MPRTYDQILAEARKLPAEERERLVDELAAGLHAPADLSPEWKREIRSRIEQIERGEVELESWAEVREKLRRATRAE
ncbi:MAG: addiction module protein [Myxococcota bacterium]